MQITTPVTKIQTLLSLQKAGKKTGAEKLDLFSQILEGMRAKKRTPALNTKTAGTKKTGSPALLAEKPVKAKNKAETADSTAAAVLAAAAQTVAPELSALKGKKKEGDNLQRELVLPALKAEASKAEITAQNPIVLQEAAKDAPQTGAVIVQAAASKKSSAAQSAEAVKNRTPQKEEEPAAKEQEPAKKPEKSNRISIHDLRTDTVPDSPRLKSEPASLPQTQQTATADSQAELLVDLRSHAPSPAVPNSAPELTAAHRFEDLLSQELQDKLSGDIVRQAQVVLKNGDAGTIRLSLKPESLGTVKVHLEMVENKLIGHIVVESAEVLRAFEREVHSLEQAFRDSGFQTAHLDTRLAGGNHDGAGGRQQQQPNGQFFSERLAAAYDSFEPEARSITGMLEMQQINVLV